MAKSNLDTNSVLADAVLRLAGAMEKQADPKRRFYLGIAFGVGTGIGASVIASAILYLLSGFVQQLAL